MLLRSFFVAAFAVCLSLGVAGCGGGSTQEGMAPDAKNVTPPDPGPAGGAPAGGAAAPK